MIVLRSLSQVGCDKLGWSRDFSFTYLQGFTDGEQAEHSFSFFAMADGGTTAGARDVLQAMVRAQSAGFR